MPTTMENRRKQPGYRNAWLAQRHATNVLIERHKNVYDTLRRMYVVMVAAEYPELVTAHKHSRARNLALADMRSEYHEEYRALYEAEKQRIKEETGWTDQRFRGGAGPQKVQEAGRKRRAARRAARVPVASP